MIRYALACEASHEFESWFPSSRAYDEQAARGLVECPVCGSAEIEKRLMSPSLGRSGGRAEQEPAAPEAAKAIEGAKPETPDLPAPPQRLALLSERDQAMRAMLRAVREHVTKTADYVGPSFADEARKMHYGETPHRAIYGEANALDTKALLEEGIEIHPLPIVPDDRN